MFRRNPRPLSFTQIVVGMTAEKRAVALCAVASVPGVAVPMARRDHGPGPAPAGWIGSRRDELTACLDPPGDAVITDHEAIKLTDQLIGRPG